MIKLKKYMLVLFFIISMIFILIGCSEAKISSDYFSIIKVKDKGIF